MGAVDDFLIQEGVAPPRKTRPSAVEDFLRQEGVPLPRPRPTTEGTTADIPLPRPRPDLPPPTAEAPQTATEQFLKEDAQVATAQAPDPPAAPPPSEDPSFWGVIAESAASAFNRRAEEIVSGGRAYLQQGTLTPPPETLPPPRPIPPIVQHYLQQPVETGWSDPKWWGARAGGWLGGSVPELLAGSVGGAALGAPGAALTAGLTTWATSVFPRYRENILERKMEQDAAATQAMEQAITEGITSGVSFGMFGVPLTGKIQAETIRGTAELFKRPFLEAMTQLGIVQPSINVLGKAAEAQITGDKYDIPEAMTDYAGGFGMGLLSLGGFHGARYAADRLRYRAMEQRLREMTPEQVQAVHDRIMEGIPEIPTLAFPRISDLVNRHPLDKRPAVDWMADFAQDLLPHQLMGIIPKWAIDDAGNVSKNDLIAALHDRYTSWTEAPSTSGVAKTVTFHSPVTEGEEFKTESHFTVDLQDIPDPNGRKGAVLSSFTGVPPAQWTQSDVVSLFRYLADNGYHRFSYADLAPEVGRFADHLGLDTGVFGPKGREVPYVDIDARANTSFGLPIAASPRLKEGVTSTMEAPPSVGKRPSFAFKAPYPSGDLKPAARLIIDMIKGWHKRFGMKYPIEIKWVEKAPTQGERGSASYFQDRTEIQINLDQHPDAASIYGTLVHEFGHALVYDVIRRLGVGQVDALFQQLKAGGLGPKKAWDAAQEYAFRTQTDPAILADLDKNIVAYRLALDDFKKRHATVAEAEMLREDAPGAFWAKMTGNQAVFSNSAYWRAFAEFMANQVARWATTNERPLSELDHKFSALGRQIREMTEWMQKETGESFEPGKGVDDWVNSFIGKDPWTLFQIVSGLQMDGLWANRVSLINAGGSGNGAVTQSAHTITGRNILTRSGNYLLGSGFAADGDRINWYYRMRLGLSQMAEINRHVRGLVYYKEIMRTAEQATRTIANAAAESLHQWHRLGPEQGDALAKLWFELQTQSYRTPTQKAQNVLRHPDATEFADLVKQTGVGPDALKVYQGQVQFFRDILERMRTFDLREAGKILNPVEQARALENIDLKYKKMLNAGPFFPMTRFGKLTFAVYDAAGHRTRFETAETDAGIRRIRAEWEKTRLPGEIGREGELPAEALPFMHAPSGLLDRIMDDVGMSKEQRAALDGLRMEYSAANSFAHHLRYRSRAPGWSLDFKRVFAQYGMTAARWIPRLEWGGEALKYIQDVRNSAKTLPPDPDGVIRGRQREQIADYMANHYREWKDPSADIAWLRGPLFMWYFSFVPVKALVNLSQYPLMTLPRLAADFGDFRMLPAAAKSLFDVRNYYKKGTYEGMSPAKMRAMAEGIRQGTIVEGQGAALSGWQNRDNIAPRVVGNKAWRLATDIIEAGTFGFNMVEQFNRRQTFSPAFDLAMKYPNARAVRDAVEFNPLQYQRLVERGWNEQEASAYVYSKYATENTQYVYGGVEKPRFMRGKMGTVLAFKNFLQNTLFTIAHWPAAGIRSLVVLGGLAGMSGLPWAEDVMGLVKGLAYRIFGKDFDLEGMVRGFIKDHFGPNPAVSPDVILHGMSRHGFGIPQLLSMMGFNMEGAYPADPHRQWKGVDLSASLGLGRNLPVDLGALLKPSQDRPGQMLNAVKQSLGPGLDFPIVLGQALLDSQHGLTDYKRWSALMPLALKNASQAIGWYREGMERNRLGQPILRFDPSEPLHMAEIIAKGIGFNPTRLAEQYDLLKDQGEAHAKWTIDQQILLNQLWLTIQTNNEEGKQKVLKAINEFNERLPEEARGYAMSREMLRKSMEKRQENAFKRERGIPLDRKDIPLFEEIQKLHPGASSVMRQPVQ